jgi:hypothetical protein
MSLKVQIPIATQNANKNAPTTATEIPAIVAILLTNSGDMKANLRGQATEPGADAAVHHAQSTAIVAQRVGLPKYAPFEALHVHEGTVFPLFDTIVSLML